MRYRGKYKEPDSFESFKDKAKKQEKQEASGFTEVGKEVRAPSLLNTSQNGTVRELTPEYVDKLLRQLREAGYDYQLHKMVRFLYISGT